MLDTTTDTRRPPLQTWHPKPANVAQRWEFIPPVVAVPPGWVQIQNASTRHILSHKYLSYPPVLIVPQSLQPSHYRESWETQWSFHMIKGPEKDPSRIWDTERTTWAIKNRLTGAILSQHDHKNTGQTVSALDRLDIATGYMSDRWYLEIDSGENWIIKNEDTYCLLQESTTGRRIGFELRCCGKAVRGDNTKIWTFVYVPRIACYPVKFYR